MNKRAIGAVAGLALPAALMLLQPFAGLGFEGTAVVAALLGAIVWWVTDVLPDYITAIVMSVAFVVLAGVPFEVVFSAFSSSTWWLMVAAFCLGLGMQRSGLLKRLAHAVMRKFPRTFRGQAAGLTLASVVSGPFIPSLTAKCAILTPLALSISDQMGYERKSKQANGLFLAVFTNVRNLAPAVISASFVGYMVLGLMPADLQAEFDLVHWFASALPWFEVVMVLNYIAIVWMHEPKEERLRGKAASLNVEPKLNPESASEDLGPMTGAEKRMLAIMSVTVLLWVLERWHGIPSSAVALAAVGAMVAAGQFRAEDIRDGGIAWDMILFMGVALSLAAVFSYVGADEWVVAACMPVLAAVAGNPYAVILGIVALTIALRFVIVSEAAFINIFMVFAVPLAPQLGVSPWIVGFVVYVMANPWFVAYQNLVYLAAVGSVSGKMTEHVGLARYCAVFLVICLIGLLVSVPYWQWMGLA